MHGIITKSDGCLAIFSTNFSSSLVEKLKLNLENQGLVGHRCATKTQFRLFFKRKSNFWILGFSCCSTRIIYYCRTDIDEAWVIFMFFGIWTDRDTISESPNGNMSAHKNFNSKLGVSCRSLYASPDDGYI